LSAIAGETDDSGREQILSSNFTTRGIWAALGAAVMASTAAAQSTSPTMSDATVVTRGAFRLRGSVEWTRIDGVFGPGGSTVLPLGSSLTTDLNVTTLPLLATGEAAAQTLAADPSLRFSAGQLTTSVDSRIASVPLMAEYGLTSRITLGIVVPIVQSRSVVSWQLNGKSDSSANIGANPAAFLGVTTAYSANAAVATGLTTARAQLSQQLSDCALSSTTPACQALLGRSAEANALISATSIFTSAVGALYGVSPTGQAGSPFVPIAGSAAQAAIDARLANLRASYTSFGLSAGSGALKAAEAAAANDQFKTLVQAPEFGIGLDSLGTTQQTALGDVELSVTSQLFNGFGSTGSVKLRAAAAGVVRLGTGHPARANHPFDVPTGDGQMDLEVRGAMDALVGSHLLTTIAGTFTLQTGSVATTRLPNTPGATFGLDFPVDGSVKYGNMASVSLNPRYMLTPALIVGALAVGSYRGADQVTVTGFNPNDIVFGNPNALTTYSGGLTISYSNLASESGTGGPSFPAEILYSHLETLGASAAGAAKGYRDSIEMRFYLGARR
jgi:hypothetical protein